MHAIAARNVIPARYTRLYARLHLTEPLVVSERRESDRSIGARAFGNLDDRSSRTREREKDREGGEKELCWIKR